MKQSEGKSGSLFFSSHDGRYMVKTISQLEKGTLVRILPNYYEHIKSNPETLLTRICGFHSISNHTLIVMMNVFDTSREVHEVYDLKGSTVGRSNTGTGVKKDLDFKRKLYLPADLRAKFKDQVESDSRFLERMEILDYSLLVGIHYEENNSKKRYSTNRTNPRAPFFAREDGGMRAVTASGVPSNEIIFVGIIDILTEYLLNKKVERWFKSLVHDPAELSAAPPGEYGPRFRSFISSLLE